MSTYNPTEVANLKEKCAHPSDPTQSGPDLTDIISKLIPNIAGLTQGCNTSNWQAALSGKLSAPLGLANASFAASASSSDVEGCQAVNAIVSNYLNTVNKVSCIISNISASNILKVNQTLTVKVWSSGPGSEVYSPSYCKEDSIVGQTISGQFKQFSQFSSEVKTAIQDTITQGLKATFDQLQSTTTGAGATPQGASQINTGQSKLSDQNIQDQLGQNITTSVAEINQLASGEFVATNGARVPLPCTISQSAVLNLQAAMIVANAYSATVSTNLSAFLDIATKQVQKNVSTGPPSALDMFKNDWMYAVIGGAVLLVVVYFLFFRKKSDNKPSSGGLLDGKVGDLLGGKAGSSIKDALKTAFRYNLRSSRK